MRHLRHLRHLRHNTYARQIAPNRYHVMRPGVIFALAFVSIALLFLSRLQQPQVMSLRLQLIELMAPALKAALVPLEPVRRVGLQISDFFQQSNEVVRAQRN